MTIEINLFFGLLKSRDTTLKVWKFCEEAKSCDLVLSLGGHRDSITCVKFMSTSDYQQSLARLTQTFADDEPLIEQLSKANCENRLSLSTIIISSSLDCSFRLWYLENDNCCCLKEFYLYNPINHFHLRESQLVFALGTLL